jgi:hypothetical protein
MRGWSFASPFLFLSGEYRQDLAMGGWSAADRRLIGGGKSAAGPQLTGGGLSTSAG